MICQQNKKTWNRHKHDEQQFLVAINYIHGFYGHQKTILVTRKLPHALVRPPQFNSDGFINHYAIMLDTRRLDHKCNFAEYTSISGDKKYILGTFWSPENHSGVETLHYPNFYPPPPPRQHICST